MKNTKKTKTTTNCALIEASKTKASQFDHPSTRAIFLALTSYANASKGQTCWPSRAALAADTGYSRATITRAIRYLKENGWISTLAQFRQNMQVSNLYTISISKLNAAIASIGRGLTATSRGAHHDQRNVHKEHPNPYYAARKDGKSHLGKQKPRSTRDMSLEECLFDTSWAT